MLSDSVSLSKLVVTSRPRLPHAAPPPLGHEEAVTALCTAMHEAGATIDEAARLRATLEQPAQAYAITPGDSAALAGMMGQLPQICVGRQCAETFAVVGFDALEAGVAMNPLGAHLHHFPVSDASQIGVYVSVRHSNTRWHYRSGSGATVWSSRAAQKFHRVNTYRCCTGFHIDSEELLNILHDCHSYEDMLITDLFLLKKILVRLVFAGGARVLRVSSRTACEAALQTLERWTGAGGKHYDMKVLGSRTHEFTGVTVPGLPVDGPIVAVVMASEHLSMLRLSMPRVAADIVRQELLFCALVNFFAPSPLQQPSSCTATWATTTSALRSRRRGASRLSIMLKLRRQRQQQRWRTAFTHMKRCWCCALLSSAVARHLQQCSTRAVARRMLSQSGTLRLDWVSGCELWRVTSLNILPLLLLLERARLLALTRCAAAAAAAFCATAATGLEATWCEGAIIAAAHLEALRSTIVPEVAESTEELCDLQLDRAKNEHGGYTLSLPDGRGGGQCARDGNGVQCRHGRREHQAGGGCLRQPPRQTPGSGCISLKAALRQCLDAAVHAVEAANQAGAKPEELAKLQAAHREAKR
ncbi:hypothetical protein JKP88DRAFT_245631 [Tribonema minus]|uniref:Uncharacterized protein n=1 Tax=Tribonema minus TaxID=303371 RepID=A0A836CEA0_9STRA|nr:hypothetical protein JKP88DRAFT_245631 [Tribonema minus]